MYYIQFRNPDLVLYHVFNGLANNPEVKQASVLESKIMQDYQKADGPHTSVLTHVSHLAGSPTISIKTPFLSYVHNRMHTVYPQGSNPRVEDKVALPLAERISEVSQVYFDAITQSAEELSPAHSQKYPLDLLLKIGSSIDFKKYQLCSLFPPLINKPELFIATSFSGYSSDGEQFFSKIGESVCSGGNVFLYGPSKSFGRLLYSMIGSQVDHGYPFTVIMNRSFMSPEFLATDFVSRSGFSSLQNAVMHFFKYNPSKNHTFHHEFPLCRINSFDANWLVNINFGRSGWNPED